MFIITPVVVVVHLTLDLAASEAVLGSLLVVLLKLPSTF
jgi:hypothetical protein